MVTYYRAQGVSLTQLVKKIEEDLDNVGKEFLSEMANFLVDKSPIWSGEYVLSHRLGERSVAGQFTGSPQGGWKTRVADPATVRETARANLLGSVSALTHMPTTISFGNTARHSAIVEYGGGRTEAYAVYSQARREAGNMLNRAVAKVRSQP